MPYCELCGSKISGSVFTVIVENVVMNVCRSCSKHGRPYNVSVKKSQKRREQFRFRLPTVRSDYSRVIKEARENLGFSHDELAYRINEGGPVVKLLEQGKLKPDPVMAKKIESSLGIKLVELSEIDE